MRKENDDCGYNRDRSICHYRVKAPPPRSHRSEYAQEEKTDGDSTAKPGEDSDGQREGQQSLGMNEIVQSCDCSSLRALGGGL